MVDALLEDDLFRAIRTDGQLARLEAEMDREHGAPYQRLLDALLGAGAHLSERAAAAIWRRVVDHRGALRARLGRPVSLRVAAIDWLYLQDEARRPFSAVVLSRALLRAALAEGRHDPVTRLPTRRFFEELLSSYLRADPVRGGVLVFADLDGFKRANDRFGHARGDHVLQEFATAANLSLRAGDLIGRIGGDEFAILLAGVRTVEARAIVDRLRAVFEARCAAEGVSFSFGVARLRVHEQGATALQRADRAMYREKAARRRERRAGRRRIA